MKLASLLLINLFLQPTGVVTSAPRGVVPFALNRT